MENQTNNEPIKVHSINKSFIVQAITGYQPQLVKLAKNSKGNGFTAVILGNGVYRRLFIAPEQGQGVNQLDAHGQRIQLVKAWLFERKAEKKNDRGYYDTFLNLCCRNIIEVKQEAIE